MKTRFLVAAVCLLVALAGVARAGCPDGRWTVEQGLLPPTEVPGLERDVIAFADGTVRIASGCPPTNYHVRERRRGGLRIRARWEQCRDVARGVRVRMRVASDCATLRGIVRTRRPFSRHRFTATVAGPCVPGDPMCPTCRTSTDCPADTYCAKAPGDCGGDGECVERPDACPEIFAPVCGCDGVTYGNDCERQMAQVQKAKDGPCACPQILCAPGTVPVDTDGDGCDDTCRAPCTDACDCHRNPFIDFEDECPLLCPTCGNFWTCDEGVCVEQCGPIPPEILECRTCRSNDECGDGTYCAMVPGDCDGLGSCEQRPDACLDIYDPVCGCDGQTYGNGCEAAAGGVNVASAGECKEPCGTLIGIPCGEGEFCQLPPGTCDVADLGGMCVEVPLGCPDVYLPVCGCDGVTYSNDCDRRAARAQKSHDGPCDCPDILCIDGTLPIDTDGDGCLDTCVDVCPLLTDETGSVLCPCPADATDCPTALLAAPERGP